MDFLKVRRNQIILGVIALLLVVGGYMVLGKSGTNDDIEDVTMEEEFEKLDPQEIGLTMEALENGRKFMFTIGKADDIKAFEYEYTYDADSKEEEGVKVPRGGGSDEPIEVDGDTYESDEFFFGSCSSGTCVPDSGVESVTLMLKVTKDDGKTYQVEDTLEL